MEQAKAAVKGILSRSGKHDTTTHEHVQPAVTHETITKEQRDEQTTAINKEVHQDHYHTSVQPINDQKILPEQHHHRQAAVQHREFEHDDADAVKTRLSEEASKFRDEQTRVEGRSTTSTGPTVAGEHVHHHVHENIQPVVQRQTVEPHVIHTTVPVHEVHHNAAQHHTASTLPAVSMNEFQKAGGVLGGREDQIDKFNGEPRTDRLMGSTTERRGQGNNMDVNSPNSSGATSGNGLSSSMNNSQNTRLSDHTSDRNSASTLERNDGKVGKPSLMDKINPMKDADGDGKKGIMS